MKHMQEWYNTSITLDDYILYNGITIYDDLNELPKICIRKAKGKALNFIFRENPVIQSSDYILLHEYNNIAKNRRHS